jgi:hypothetical protein
VFHIVFIYLFKKNCFVKEKGKKESFLPSGCMERQKGIGINEGLCEG